MKQVFVRISQPPTSVKTLPSPFDKAIFQYAFYDNTFLIIMLSHKSTVHSVTTKAIFWKLICIKAITVNETSQELHHKVNLNI
jgi:hypothetical protein